MNNGKVNWHGSFVAVITPFTEAGEIDEPAFRDNLDFLVQEGVDGVVVSGCTGESWSLTPDERVRLFTLAIDTVNGKVPVIAGTGGISTQGVIDLSLRAKQAGAAGVMVLPPYYAMPGVHEVVAHYEAISNGVRHPILLYNIPRRVGFNLVPDVLARVVPIEWVVAIKESSNDFIQLLATVQGFGDQIDVLTGHSAVRGVPAVVMGAKGYVSSMESQIMGREAIEMYALVKRGDLARARAVQMRTLVLDEAMHRVGTFPANLKAAMNLLGRRAGYPRPPLLPVSGPDLDRVTETLDRMGLMKVRA